MWVRKQDVSTHSRPKAAGSGQQGGGTTRNVSTHSRPKAAGHALENARDIDSVSTHSRPKAAGGGVSKWYKPNKFQLTAARRRLVTSNGTTVTGTQFQLTAARRRLVRSIHTKSRQKMFQLTAARRRLGGKSSQYSRNGNSFNSQPPEGGWSCFWGARRRLIVSTHSRPKAAGSATYSGLTYDRVSTHSRPKAAG